MRRSERYFSATAVRASAASWDCADPQGSYPHDFVLVAVEHVEAGDVRGSGVELAERMRKLDPIQNPNSIPSPTLTVVVVLSPVPSRVSIAALSNGEA